MRRLLFHLPLAAFLLPAAAHADAQDRRIAALFDRPVATRTVPAKSDAEEGNELRCTYFRDFMVREIGTDTPAPGAATLIPVSAGATRPGCDKKPAAHELPLKTENYTFLGRKGPFLVFEATDPNGAVPFMVLQAEGGKTVYSDGTIEGAWKSVILDKDGLHLRFTHGANGSCSLLKDEAACWSKMAAEGTIPAAIAQTPPPLQSCATAYRKDKAPADDPSIISYDVDMVIDATGTAQMKSHGSVGCSAMP